MRLLLSALLALAAGDTRPGTHSFPKGRASPSALKAACGKAGDAEIRGVWEVAGTGRFLVLAAAPEECDDTGCSRELTLAAAEAYASNDDSEPETYDPPAALLDTTRKLLKGCPTIERDEVPENDEGATLALWTITDKAGSSVDLVEVDDLAGYSEEGEQCAGGPGAATEPCKARTEAGDALISLSKDAKTVKVQYGGDAAPTTLQWTPEDGAFDEK